MPLSVQSQLSCRLDRAVSLMRTNIAPDDPAEQRVPHSLTRWIQANCGEEDTPVTFKRKLLPADANPRGVLGCG